MRVSETGAFPAPMTEPPPAPFSGSETDKTACTIFSNTSFTPWLDLLDTSNDRQPHCLALAFRSFSLTALSLARSAFVPTKNMGTGLPACARSTSSRTLSNLEKVVSSVMA